ncbi:MAG: single-stranded DNA-binding protein [Gammaproteobacteria bacterium]|nr:single-stranded DNA-binding protein [Gammaproteobacteria bacterium]
MMGSVNKVILIGNLGADPEVSQTQSGTSVAKLRMATNESWTDKSGNRQERTEWHRVTVWGKTAEHCGQSLSQGRQVYVEGRLQTSEYTDKEGITRKATEIVADRVVFLSGAGAGGGQGGGQSGGGNWGGSSGGGKGGGGWGGGSNGGGGQGWGGAGQGGGQAGGQPAPQGGGGGWGNNGQQGGSGGRGGAGQPGGQGGAWGGQGGQQGGGGSINF